MWDKTFIFIIILFVFVGFFTYEKYLIDKGEVSLTGQLIDYVDTADFNDSPSVIIKKFRDSYLFDYKNLDRLREKYSAIEDQRDALINPYSYLAV